MALKLTPESFLAGVRQSGLVEAARFEEVLRQMKSAGVSFADADTLAAGLVSRQAITEWQAEKLLQGRHKGFVLGRYRLLSLLGKGEMSAVYLAEHVRMHRRCAIKVLPAHRVRDTSYLARFQREAQAVAALDHPNIVRAYDVDQEAEGEAEIHFLVMEYIPGQHLEAYRRTKGQLSLTEAVEIIRQAAEGLAHAHQAGLVHRDIKPENLLVDLKGTVKLNDLGIARFFKEDDLQSLTIKHDEKVLGSADYLAPEQAIDSHKVDARADIYSLGCTLYFALCGHPPFTEGTLVQRLLAHQTKLPTAIRTVRADIPESLAAIIEKMMAKRADDRYQTTTEVAEALAGWLVEYGDDAWKRSHLNVIAAVRGLEALMQMLKPATAKPAAVAPVPTPAAPARESILDDLEPAELATITETVPAPVTPPVPAAPVAAPRPREPIVEVMRVPTPRPSKNGRRTPATETPARPAKPEKAPTRESAPTKPEIKARPVPAATAERALPASQSTLFQWDQQKMFVLAIVTTALLALVAIGISF